MKRKWANMEWGKWEKRGGDREGGGGWGGGRTWYALMASSRKTNLAKQPLRTSLLARFHDPGITISSICPNGSKSALITYPSQPSILTPNGERTTEMHPGNSNTHKGVIIQGKAGTASSIFPLSLETYKVLLTLARSTRIIRPSKTAFWHLWSA